MKPLKDMMIIQIDITNHCDKMCSNCTRLIGNHRKDQLYFMDLEFFEKAVISLKDFPGIVGVMGGEPTLHPEFEEICKILNKYRKNQKKKGIWTNKGKFYYKHESIINETFGFLGINDHTGIINHTPLLVSSSSLIKDEKIRNKFIDECWIQVFWSAVINPKGGFFCEVAGALSLLMDGPEGMDIEKNPDWWKLPLEAFKVQKEWACNKCGGAIPLKPRSDKDEIDDMSEDNYEILKNQSFKIKNNKFSIYKEGIEEDQIRGPLWYRRSTDGKKYDIFSNG